MDNSPIKKLCMALMKADDEQTVINIIEEVGYWDNDDAWRYYGDTENNYSTIGNQQSRPEAALVEKIVNSIDARLTNECCVNNLDPETDEAPVCIRDAVAAFFEDNPNSPTAGLVTEWLPSKRTEVARGNTLAATGAKPKDGFPCFTISDNGEGQTPAMMPYTLLSIDRKNKQRIPFVQGKFNMGGTGALKFCGHHNLQLVLSRRNPSILNGGSNDPTDLHWGFTIVRREDPTGGRRSSVYSYLAPIEIDENPQKGKILSFKAESLPIFPEGRTPYKRNSGWGTLIKLYEYKATGFKSHILMPDGLLSRIDLLLPSLALPARFHECRDYKGHRGSPETTVTGLNVRLGDDKAENIEEDFPIADIMNISGENMRVTIYAFKKDKAKTYRKREGIIFTVNGQTHGHLTTDFFRRRKTGCSYLRDSLLVVVDCSNLSGRSIEDLFMNSRDRLSGTEFRWKIEENLETILKSNEIIRRLKNKRQQEQRDAKIDDSKPLKDILSDMFKKSPTLSKLFLQGTRISNPYITDDVASEDQPYKGKKYPTFFKFKGKEYGYILVRDCHLNVKARITFETDVVNDYFGREIDKGEFNLYCKENDKKYLYDDYTLNMQNGIATLNLELPEICKVGDEHNFEALVTDRTRVEPIINSFVINVREEANKLKSRPSTRRKPPSGENGSSREIPSVIDPPNCTKVYQFPEEGQKGWFDMTPPFTKYSALTITDTGEYDEENEDSQQIYDFFINMDNIFLKNEQKNNSKRDPEIMSACFLYGMILMGISLIHDDIQDRKSEKDNEDERTQESNGYHIEDKVAGFTKAIAPVLLPMIENLGSIDGELDFIEDATGEAT